MYSYQEIEYVHKSKRCYCYDLRLGLKNYKEQNVHGNKLDDHLLLPNLGRQDE